AATSRSDLYSLGVVMYEALTGTKPFVGDTPAAIAYAVLDSKPVPALDLRPDADPDLVAAVERAMARNPDERFDSADAMADALSPDVSREALRASTHETEVLSPTDVLVIPSAAPTTAVRPAPRRRREGLLIALVAVAAVAAIALAVRSRDDSS